jgi:hypothetical protein
MVLYSSSTSNFIAMMMMELQILAVGITGVGEEAEKQE